MSSKTTSQIQASVQALPKPLSTFKQLSPVVSLHSPPASAPPPHPSHPTTILLCAWLDATPKHIDYYTRTYIRLYPSTRIILITISTTEFMVQSETRRRLDTISAVHAILSPNQSAERLHIHALSNGGSKRVYGIAGSYRAMTGKPLPVKSYILDSAPGIPQFRRGIHALAYPARNFNWFFWIPYMLAIYITVSVVFVSVNWMPKWHWRELVWGPTEGLNDLKLVCGKCVKGYVYSREDRAVDWRDVERHASVAEGKGYRVLKKRVEEAEHVQMFRGKGGEHEYWGFVERVWGLGHPVV